MTFVAVWIDFKGTVPSKINLTEKDKYCTMSHMWSLKKQDKTKRIENRLVVARGRG